MLKIVQRQAEQNLLQDLVSVKTRYTHGKTFIQIQHALYHVSCHKSWTHLKTKQEAKRLFAAHACLTGTDQIDQYMKNNWTSTTSNRIQLKVQNPILAKFHNSKRSKMVSIP